MTVHRPLSLALACGMLALASLAARAAAVDWAKAELFTVTMTEYRFTPSDLKFRRGVPYRLHLQNDGKETHEFSAPEFFKAVDQEPRGAGAARQGSLPAAARGARTSISSPSAPAASPSPVPTTTGKA